MLSEQVAKIWRRVTFALAMLTALEYSTIFIPVVRLLAPKKLFFLYVDSNVDCILAFHLLAALSVSIVSYVLIQPKKWKAWLYSDYARYGGFFVISALALCARYAKNVGCPAGVYVSGRYQLALSALIWFLPPVLRKINKVESYDKIRAGTQAVLMGYLIAGLFCIRFEIHDICNFPKGFETVVLLWLLMGMTSFIFISASFWGYYFEYKQTKEPFLFRFLLYTFPFLYAGFSF